jgi:hypothetical protein
MNHNNDINTNQKISKNIYNIIKKHDREENIFNKMRVQYTYNYPIDYNLIKTIISQENKKYELNLKKQEIFNRK